MGEFVAGDVVVVSFPFSDLSQTKRRPGLVLAEAEFGDLILCQVTSKPYSSRMAVQIDKPDFSSGGLPVVSYARPDKLFTADPRIVERAAGKLQNKTLLDVLSRVKRLFRQGQNSGGRASSPSGLAPPPGPRPERLQRSIPPA
jgi:mRNA interferase MazF